MGIIVRFIRRCCRQGGAAIGAMDNLRQAAKRYFDE